MLLRSKLLLLTLLMILFTVLVILGASQYFSRQTLGLSVSATQELASSDLAHIVSGAHSLAETNAAATRLQQKTAVKNYLRSIADGLQARVSELHATLPPQQAWQQLRTDLLRVKIGGTGYVFGMNSEGVLTVHPKSEGKNLGGESHIQEMARNKEGFISYHSVTAKRDKAVYYRYFQPLDLIIAPGVFIDEMAELYDREAEQRLWDSFVDQLRGIRLGKTGSVWILDASKTAEATFVLPPESTDAGQLAGFPVAEILAAARQAQPGRPTLQHFVLEKGGVAFPQMAAVAYFPQNGWVIGASVPEQEMLATSQRIASSFAALKISMIVAAILTLLTASVLMMWLTRRSFAPLQRGVSFAEQVAAGNLTATLQVSGKDEIGSLAVALNAMVQGLRSMVSQTQQTTSGMEEISGRLADAAEKLEGLSGSQAERSSEMASAIAQIGASIREVDESVSRLGEAATENTTSILELSASIEEVATNMQAVHQAGQEVSAAASEMAATSRQIADSSRQLGEASADTASAIFQMDAGIRNVEQHAGGMAKISHTVLSDARAGQDSVESTAAGIREISSAMRNASKVIEDLSRRAENIGKIVSVIDEVAGEIDLLALNAAIIAAQAGANGRGFAVVAEEIKELAGRTTLSTREIAEVVEGVRGGIREANSLIRVVDEKTGLGEQLADQAGAMLVKVVDGVGEVNGGIHKIAGAMSEQAGGSSSIKQATETVSSMVGQIVQATGEQERASGEIQRAAERLKQLAEQVTASTREQARASATLARNTEGMNGMVQGIGRACSEQVRSSELIERTGEDVQASTRTTLQANQMLTESIDGLMAEVDKLNRQIAAFRTAEADAEA